MVNDRTYRRISPTSGFSIGPVRTGPHRRALGRLRPEGGLIPLDLDLIEVVAELDPGMIDWRTDFTGPSSQPTPAGAQRNFIASS